MTPQLANQMTKYFGVVYEGRSAAQLRAQIDAELIIRYSRFRLAGDGDSARTADLVDRDPSARDNSYVRVSPALHPSRTHH
jgi:hypothetical protein